MSSTGCKLGCRFRVEVVCISKTGLGLLYLRYARVFMIGRRYLFWFGMVRASSRVLFKAEASEKTGTAASYSLNDTSAGSAYGSWPAYHVELVRIFPRIDM